MHQKWTLGLGSLLALSLACTQHVSSPPAHPEPAAPEVPVQEHVSRSGDFRSAVRFEGETYEDALARHQKLAAVYAPERLTAAAAARVVDSQVPVSQANFSNVPVWSDADIKAQFEYSRDLRFQTMPGSPSFQRRLTWLYPDDGCYSRAELVCVKAEAQGKTRPAKLFSFGSLRVKTSNHSAGYVSWWYHVVPVVRSASTHEPMVLDAAIDPTKPLPWKDWLLKQVDALSSVKVTVADTNAYYPGSPVTGGSNQAAQASRDQVDTFLKREWDRQVALGRDASSVLGNNPPWLLPAVITLKAKANGQYVCAENGGSAPLIANRVAAAAWETFDVTYNGDGSYSFKARANGRFVCADQNGDSALIANRTAIGDWEKFWVTRQGDGSISLKAKANGKYVCAENGGVDPLIANRGASFDWEQFWVN